MTLSIGKKTDDIRLKEFSTFAFARLQNTVNECCLCNFKPYFISVEEFKSAFVFLKLSSAMMEESADGDTDIMEDEEMKGSAKTIVGRSPYSSHYKEI